MTVPLFVIAFLLLFALWAVGMGLAWHRIDRLQSEIRKAWTSASEGWAAAKEAHTREIEALETARQWIAEAESNAMDLENHQHVCLGVLVPEDSGVK